MSLHSGGDVGVTAGSGSGASGGSVSVTADTVNLASGAAGGSAGCSGSVSIGSASGSSSSGDVSLSSGGAEGASSGSVSMRSGASTGGQAGSVLLLESGELGGPQCASAMCCGLLDNMGFPTDCGGENELDAVLILGTQRIYEELHSRRDISFERRPCLTLAVTPAQQQHAAHEVATLKSLGYRHVQYLSGDEARALEPLLSEDVLGAVSRGP